MPTATPCCSLRQRNLPTDSRYPTVNQHSLSQAVLRNPETLSELKATSNLGVNALLQFMFTEKLTGRSYAYIVYEDGNSLYDVDNGKFIWSYSISN